MLACDVNISGKKLLSITKLITIQWSEAEIAKYSMSIYGETWTNILVDKK